MGSPRAVAVVLPSHNPGDYLAGALHSVRDQTFCDLHIYLIDDGSSTDRQDVLRARRGFVPLVAAKARDHAAESRRSGRIREALNSVAWSAGKSITAAVASGRARSLGRR